MLKKMLFFLAPLPIILLLLFLIIADQVPTVLDSCDKTGVECATQTHNTANSQDKAELKIDKLLPPKMVEQCDLYQTLKTTDENTPVKDLPNKQTSYETFGMTLNTHFQPSTEQGRSLVIFIDGTGQTGQQENKVTSIWRLYQLAITQACDKPIIPFYHEGIGTSWGNWLRGKMTGHGIENHIKRAYRFLAETYQPGDKIFIFGFSRGAYTARALNGMLEFADLLNVEGMSAKAIDSAMDGLFDHYHQSNDGHPNFDARLRCDIDEYKEAHDLNFHPRAEGEYIVNAIGVFDTVPSIGLSLDDYPDNYRVELYADKGFHALSIDEQRNDFRPLRYDGRIQPNQKLDEVWFAGDHSDVGGGNQQPKGLERISREWMVKNFAEYEIFPTLSDPLCESPEQPCEAAALHDGLLASSAISKYIYAPSGLHWRKPMPGDTLHGSVLCRLQIKKLSKPHCIREPNKVYRPENLYPCIEQSYKFTNYTCAEEGELPEPYGGSNCPSASVTKPQVQPVLEATPEAEVVAAPAPEVVESVATPTEAQ